jgi:hypothetical protein
VATPPTPAPAHSGRLARRALLAVAGLGLCGAGAALTPTLLNDARTYTQDQLEAAFAAGAANARQALLNDLSNLEGFSIDAALAAAQLTKLAVKYIVGPAATLVAILGVGALDIVIGALELVLNGLNFIPGGSSVQQPLKQLHDMLASWRLNLSLLPQSLTTYANWDIDSAEGYLKALQNMIAAQQHSSPTATPTP